ncbi:uncharacterized protein LOC131854428 [Achroia grisella]|uniref:uncharacterized protein LOC131854428 n=1 Tax=Achroia grisella TaxID=688607 RepID=UPI0027D2A68D|nr:uncharacterized protein LOC131854428 [Achroia grisella]
MCKSNHSFHNAGRGRAGRVYGVECDVSSEPEDDIFYISSVDCSDDSGGWFQILTCENGYENFKLDSGADFNIISFSTFLKLGFDPNIIVKKKLSLISYTHDMIPLKGICTIPWYYKNIIYNLKFAVADMECSSVLGRNSCEELGLIKRIMSINYPQANGKSERAVQTIKMILKKSIKSNGDFDLALLNYRNTPRDGLSSPAQLLMGRRLRCQLPVHENLLKPKPVDPSEYRTMLHKQNNNKMYYDQHSKTLPMLRDGDSVICIDGKVRSRGKIVGRANTPRSYIVKNSVGARYRRNRRHLIRCESDPQSMHSDDVKDEQYSDACEYSCTSSDEASNPNSEQLIRKAKAVAIQRLRKKL